MKTFFRRLFGEPKKKELWCTFVATIGYDDNRHPYFAHLTYDSLDEEAGTRKFVDICKTMRTYRVVEVPYKKV